MQDPKHPLPLGATINTSPAQQKAEMKLRLEIRKRIHEEIGGRYAAPAKDHGSPDLKVPESKEQLPMYEQVIEIAKAAGHYIQKLEQMTKKEMPTAKSANAISEMLEGFHAVLEDMVRNPTAYLDESPDKVVSDFESEVDGEIQSLNKSEPRA